MEHDHGRLAHVQGVEIYATAPRYDRCVRRQRRVASDLTPQCRGSIGGATHRLGAGMRVPLVVVPVRVEAESGAGTDLEDSPLDAAGCQRARTGLGIGDGGPVRGLVIVWVARVHVCASTHRRTRPGEGRDSQGDWLECGA